MASKRTIASRAFAIQADVSVLNGSDSSQAPRDIRIIARSPGPVSAPNMDDDGSSLGPVVHDLSGAFAKARFPIDYQHDPRSVIGFGSGVEVTEEGLVVSATLIPHGDDMASRVIHHLQSGIPYEASIYFPPSSPDDVLVEDVPEGASASANGQTYSGPISIVRRWPLRGVAITPYGMDSATSTGIASSYKQDQPSAYAVTVKKKEQDMDDKQEQAAGCDGKEKEQMGAEAAPAAEAPAQSESKPAMTQAEMDAAAALKARLEAEAKDAKEISEMAGAHAAAATKAAQALATEMSAEFGPEFAMSAITKGLTVEQARVEYCAKLRSDNESLRAEIATIKATASPAGFCPDGQQSAYAKLTPTQRAAVDEYCKKTPGANKEKIAAGMVK